MLRWWEACASSAALEWGDAAAAAALGGPFDLLLASDCIYEVQSVRPLLATLRALCDERSLVAVCTDESIGRRDAYAAFEAAASEWFDEVGADAPFGSLVRAKSPWAAGPESGPGAPAAAVPPLRAGLRLMLLRLKRGPEP